MRVIPRMTTRRWMLLVMVVALAFGTFASVRRRTHLLSIAEHHERIVREMRSTVAWRLTPDGRYVKEEWWDPLRVGYHEDLARKYARAAAFPWLSVEPDPPTPW